MDLVATFDALDTPLLLFLFVGLAFLAAGFFVKKNPTSQRLRIAGWIIFGLYWPTQSAHFFAEGQPVDGYFTLFGPLLVIYIAVHEWRSIQWHEDPEALRWLAGAAFVSAATYFVIYKIPAVTDALIYATTVQSVWMMKLVFGVGGTVRNVGGEWSIFLNGSDYAVTVILACTAIQSIMIFVGAIATTVAPRLAKLKAYLWTVPTIYLLNLFRNAGIVYGYKIIVWNPFGWGGPAPAGAIAHFFWSLQPDTVTQCVADQGYTAVCYGQGSFEWLHSYVGKFGSLAALVGIALAVFLTLPELHNNILDIFDLRKRNKPGFFQPPKEPPVMMPGATNAANETPAKTASQSASK
ncbi:MAG: archaeosortase A [Thermoplasmatota archaeon]